MKTFWIQVVGLSLIIMGGFYFYSNPAILYTFFPNNNPQPQPQTELKIGENILNVEIADTPDKRAYGLSGRDSMSADSGMLFVFTESKQYQFWMKGMKIPLDIIFIREGRVVDLLESILPPEPNQKDSDLPKFAPTVPVDMVLEVNSNYIDSHGIKVGDAVLLIK